MKSSKQLNDPWAKLDAMMAKEKEPTGPEWFTNIQYQSRYGICDTASRRRLNKMEADGLLESWTGMAPTPGGPKRIITKYRIKDTQ